MWFLDADPRSSRTMANALTAEFIAFLLKLNFCDKNLGEVSPKRQTQGTILITRFH